MRLQDADLGTQRERQLELSLRDQGRVGKGRKEKNAGIWEGSEGYYTVTRMPKWVLYMHIDRDDEWLSGKKIQTKECNNVTSG